MTLVSEVEAGAEIESIEAGVEAQASLDDRM